MIMENTNQFRIGLDIGSTTVKIALVDTRAHALVYSDYQRHNAKQPLVVARFLREAQRRYPTGQFHVAVCGSGGMPFAEALKINFVQETSSLGRVFRQTQPNPNKNLTILKYCKYPRASPWHLLKFKLRLTPFGRVLIHPREIPWNSALRVILET